MPESTTDFSAETVGRDGSKRTFSDLEFLLSRSAEKDDLLSVTLRWGCRLFEPLGSKAEIVLVFQVEGKIKLKNGFTFDNDNPLVRLQVSGESHGWVEATFERIEPYIKETRVEKLYSHLEFLKRQGWNFVLSFSASCVVGWYIWIWIGKRFADEREEFIESSRKTLYESFRALPTIEGKLDLVAKNVIWPPDYVNREANVVIL